MNGCEIGRQRHSGTCASSYQLMSRESFGFISVIAKRGRARFRRQVPIGRYVADFCCLSAKLIVILDDGQHADSARDEERTRYLAVQGFRVLRFWNRDERERRRCGRDHNRTSLRLR